MLRNLIVETGAPPGVGATVSLAGAVAGSSAWSAFPSGSQVFYFVTDGAQSEWGVGTYTSGTPNTLSRDTVAGNSARTTARLNFTVSVRVYNEVPAEFEVWRDPNGNVNLAGKALTGLADGTAPDHAATVRQLAGAARADAQGDIAVAGQVRARSATLGSGAATGSTYVTLDAAAGFQRFVRYQTGAVNAWTLGEAETAGGPFVLQRFDSAGNYVENTVVVDRGTGEFRHTTPLVAASSLSARAAVDVANARGDFTSSGNATVNLNSTSDVCNVAFNLTGTVATKLGFTRAGQFEIGGWSWAARRWVVDGDGNTTQPGNVDAFAATILNRATVGELVSRAAVYAGADQTQGFYHNAQYNYWQDASDGWAMRYTRATGLREWVGNGNTVQMALTPAGQVNPTGGYVGRAGPGNTVGNVFNIYWDGAAARLFIDTTYVGNLATTSDYRVKHQVRDLPNGRAALMALRPVLYRWRSRGVFADDGQDRAGFLAHEAQAAIPSAATGAKDGADGDGAPVLQSLDLTPVVAVLTQQLQDAHRRLDALTTRVAMLEAQAT